MNHTAPFPLPEPLNTAALTQLKKSRYNIITGFKSTHTIVHNLLRETGFLVPQDKAALIDAILDDPAAHAHEPLLEPLLRAGCLIPSDTDESALITQKKIDFETRQEDTLTLTIIPTYQCNLKCVYCWEDTKDSNDAMPAEAQERLLQYIEAQLPSFSALNIEWFGGEPMMAYPVMQNLSRRIDEICKSQKTPYFCSLTTNGTMLTVERFEFLLKYHARFFQVTLDGPQALHDRNRPLKSGRRAESLARENPEALGKELLQFAKRGTYDRILQNLRDICDQVRGRFEFIVRLNVTKETQPYLDEFLDFYRSEFGDDWRFQLYIQGVEEHDGIRADEMSEKYLDKTEDVVDSMFDAAIDRDIRLNSLRVDGPGDLMCKSRQKNTYFVNSDGRFYKCDMCMNDKHVTFLGDLTQEGALVENASNLQDWNTIEPPGYCKDCVLQPLCFGLKCPYYNTIEGKTRCELFNSHSAARNAVKTFAQEGKYEIYS